MYIGMMSYLVAAVDEGIELEILKRIYTEGASNRNASAILKCHHLLVTHPTGSTQILHLSPFENSVRKNTAFCIVFSRSY
jgi:hypothetical protein